MTGHDCGCHRGDGRDETLCKCQHAAPVPVSPEGLARAVVNAGPPPDALMDGSHSGQELRDWWLDKYAPVLAAAYASLAERGTE